MNELSEHRCDFCTGTVRPVTAQGEPLRMGSGVVLLENVAFGRCDHCGHRYFPLGVLKLAESVLQKPNRTVAVPVAAG